MMSRPPYTLGHFSLAIEQSTEMPEEDACFSTYIETRNSPLCQHSEQLFNIDWRRDNLDWWNRELEIAEICHNDNK